MLLPVLHGRADGPFLTAWSFQPAIVAGLILAAGLYAIAVRHGEGAGRRPPPVWQRMAYYGGLLTVALALLGPLDAFNDDAFFLHMVQHLALMQIAAPLILLGRPLQVFLRGLAPRYSRPVLRTLLRPRGTRWALTVLTNPLTAFLLFNGSLIFWHVPKFYDAALESGTVHEVEHLAFFATALLYWWAIIEPVPRHHKVAAGWALGSVFFTTVVANALGAVLTLAGGVIYPFYLTTTNPWNLSPQVDQQLGGLIMWIGGGMIYAAILLGMLIQAINREGGPDEDAEEGWIGDQPRIGVGVTEPSDATTPG